MYTQLSYQIAQHKYLEIINSGETVIVLYSDDGTTIFKETHTFTCPRSPIGFLTVGSTVETIVTESASGSWDDRYNLEYTADTTEENSGVDDTPAETPAEPNADEPAAEPAEDINE